MTKIQSSREKDINNLLHDLLGNPAKYIDDDLLYNSKTRRGIEKKETLSRIKSMDEEKQEKLYKILSFYKFKSIASSAIEKNKEQCNFSGYAADNELLLGLVSIIDWLACGEENCRGGFLNRFNEFLRENLVENNDWKSFKKMISSLSVQNKRGEIIKLTDYPLGRNNGRSCSGPVILCKFACYVYEVRSYVVHYACLGGMYQYGISFSINNDTGKVNKSFTILKPEMVRNVLWKAIFAYFGLSDICVNKYK